MCGIIGGIAQRNVAPVLLEGLKRMEYRGYDSAGIAVLAGPDHRLARKRVAGKVPALIELYQQDPIEGKIGIAHTRWATHGKPAERNAHPLYSHHQIAVVHNGIIENYSQLREKLLQQGYEFQSDTDTEVVAHLIYHYLQKHQDMLAAISAVRAELTGAYALGILNQQTPDRLFAIRYHTPLIVGLGDGENFFASDPLALAPVAQRFMYLEDGDIAEVERTKVTVYDARGQAVKRPVQPVDINVDASSKGTYRHFMLKEIHEQPETLAQTLQEHLVDDHLASQWLGPTSNEILPKIQRVHIVACGTSYHAGLVGKYWMEEILRIPCTVEVASEYRYRHPIVEEGTLLVAISQSGETADTLAALRQAKTLGYLSTLAICNVAQSTLVRETDLALLTRAGPEIGVAATKTFTAQLLALLLLVLHIGQSRKMKAIAQPLATLKELPRLVRQTLLLEDQIQVLARTLSNKQQALFLGRGVMYPIALEGALKLKEISYIFVEAYPAGELKHGTLALVDEAMPVIVVAPQNALAEKLMTNVEEVRARGGIIYAIVDEKTTCPAAQHVVKVSTTPEILAPIIYTIPLQLLAYHTAVLKGTDVDQPRNLAKSVTVE
jgi:glutamine---fructose-6-phosphate transaminase (isomerizing)